MKKIYIEIYDYLKEVFKDNGFDTTMFLVSYDPDNDNKYFFIKENKAELRFEFDITTRRLGAIDEFLSSNSEFTSIKFDTERYESKYEDEEGKYKYFVDLYISKQYIRKFKINKLLHNDN